MPAHTELEVQINQHTMEPWAYGEDNDGWYLERVGSDEQIGYALSMEDARRIVACVNACTDIGTEVMEKYWPKGGLLPCCDIHEKAEQRDALHAALTQLEVAANTVVGCYERNPANFALALRTLSEAAEAARKVLGETNG